jgi:hypothetical protein
MHYTVIQYAIVQYISLDLVLRYEVTEIYTNSTS